VSVDLLSLLARFEAIDDVEVDLGFYRTRVPSVGASAYLNVIFKPADAAVRKELEADLLVPSDHDVGRPRASWTGLSEWLSSEIPRVATCFDHRGRLLVPAESTLPGTSH
jgi:hypothetical protein